MTLTKLETVIQKSRVAILNRIARTAQAAVTESISDVPLTRWQAQTRSENQARAAALLPVSAVFSRESLPNSLRRPEKAVPSAWLEPVQQGPQEADSRPAWLIDALQFCDEQERAKEKPRARVIRQVQRQPVPLLAELLKLEPFRPKRGKGAGTAGAGLLAELLDWCARIALAVRPHLYTKDGRPPRQIVMHLCAELLAEILDVSENTIRDWTTQLQTSGYLYARAHKTTATNKDGKQVTMIDGTLYAVRLTPHHQARLRYTDYKREYRDLDADRATGRTAYNAIRNARQRAEERQEAQEANRVLDGEKFIEGSLKTPIEGGVQAELREQLRRWAVIPGNITTENPLQNDPSVISPEEIAKRLNGVQDVVYLLPTLTDAHKSKRAALVGIMAATLARDLNDEHSRDYYCKTIWQAWQAELEGRDGLQHLAAQLERLQVDRREWVRLRNPAAVLAARLRAA